MHCILVCICSVNNTTMEPTFQVLWYFGNIINDDHIDNFFFNNYCVQRRIFRFQQQGLWSRTQFMHAQALLATPRNLVLCQPQCLYWEIMYNRTVRVQSHCDWVAATLGKPDLKCLKLKKKEKGTQVKIHKQVCIITSMWSYHLLSLDYVCEGTENNMDNRWRKTVCTSATKEE